MSKRAKKNITENEIFIFELRLVVIGILLTVYLQLIPSLFKPIIFFGQHITFEFMNMFFLVIGLLWFIVLIDGVYCLLSKKVKETEMDTFYSVFKFTFLLMIAFLVFLITSYTILFFIIALT